MRKVENESNNFSYFIKGKYVIEVSPNSRGFSGRPDQLPVLYPSIVLYRPTRIGKVQRKYPALQLDKRSEILEVKAAQSLRSVVFAS